MSSEMVSSLRIRAPEGTGCSLELAGPFVRFPAMLIDTACSACTAAVLCASLYLAGIISLDVAKSLFIGGTFLFSLGYGICLEWFWRGQTLGKRVLRLRVMDEQGLPLQLGQVVMRNLLRTLDMFPVLYLLGGAVCFLSGTYRRLGDIAAGTVVVRTPGVAPPNLENLSSHCHTPLRQYRGLGVQLRRTVSAEEASLALRALLHGDEMEPAARRAFFAELADHFRSRVPFLPDASGGLSHEQCVRAVLKIVYGLPPPERNNARPR